MTNKILNKDVIVVAELLRLAIKDKTERIGITAQAMIYSPVASVLIN